ncbi:MAG: tripartite tricarboxylate transporter substrate binding protein [Bacillota bacterium]
MKKKSLFVLLCILLLTMTTVFGCNGKSEKSSEQEGKQALVFPESTITFVCWSSAGSPLDTFMRQLAQAAEKELGQSIVVDNRTGGSGAVAMSYVNSLPADGYTVLSTTGSMTFSMATNVVPFSADDFTYLTTAQAEPSSIAVLKDSPLETLEDFVNYLKANPNGVSIGGFAAGGFHNFVMHKFKKAAGFEATWIPFEGGADAVTALLGGHIDVAFITPSSALSQIQDGNIRLLAISTPERSVNFPDVPTFKEKGYDVVEMLWRGVMAKKGIPEDVQEVLIDAFLKAFESPEFKKYMQDFYQEEFVVSGEEMRALINREVEERTSFARELGL